MQPGFVLTMFSQWETHIAIETAPAVFAYAACSQTTKTNSFFLNGIHLVLLYFLTFNDEH